MLKEEIKEVVINSKTRGWILEPETKKLLSFVGLDVPRYLWTTRIEEAIRFAEEIGYPVVGKVVSPKVIHKSDRNGVEIGIHDEKKLRETFERFNEFEGFAGILVEETLCGLELIVGAKNDYQFGPVILFGLGGVWAEIYRDIILRMAPLRQKDIEEMMRCLKARPLLEGYRGAPPVNFEELSKLLVTLSELVMDLESFFESIDLNPVICSSERCIVADARIMLKS